MKKLFIFSMATVMLVSCGKNSQPAPVDYNDDDGDQIFNYLEISERDKYVSNFQQISAKKADLVLRLKNLAGDLKVIETKIEFNKDIRAELTKSVFQKFDSAIILHESDYFSEFATAQVKPSEKKVQTSELASNGGEIEIIFDTEEMNQDYVSVMKKINGKYEELFSGQVNKKILKAEGLSSQLLSSDILSKTDLYFINNSNLKRKQQFFTNTLTEDLKKKTYRLIISTHKETNIYYVSNNLSIQSFLDLEKIDLTHALFREGSDHLSLYGDTHHIDEKSYIIPLNFLPASMNSKLQAGRTYAIYAAKASEIKKDYFNALSSQTGRTDRVYHQPFQLSYKKSLTKELVLDFDIQKTVHTLSANKKRYRYNNTGGPQIYSCWIDVIEPTGTHSIEANILSPIDLGLSFTIDGRSINPSQEMNIEKDGKIIKRMIFKQVGENIIARFAAPLFNAKYGCVNNGCVNTNSNPEEYRNCQLSEMIGEASFSVSYQAYIE
ncbi:MAG: hypothetical protein ACOVP4_13980 [Bacteriovoracaceae bacterium]